MAGATAIDINEVIDGQKIKSSTIVFLVLATLSMVADGFDLAAMGFVGPELVKGWHIAPAQLAPIFTAGLVGMFIGAPFHPETVFLSRVRFFCRSQRPELW